MDLEEGMLQKIVVSVGAVAIFISLIIAIGTTYYNDGLGNAGGTALVGAIVFFILLMGAVGVYFAR